MITQLENNNKTKDIMNKSNNNNYKICQLCSHLSSRNKCQRSHNFAQSENLGAEHADDIRNDGNKSGDKITRRSSGRMLRVYTEFRTDFL